MKIALHKRRFPRWGYALALLLVLVGVALVHRGSAGLLTVTPPHGAIVYAAPHTQAAVLGQAAQHSQWMPLPLQHRLGWYCLVYSDGQNGYIRRADARMAQPSSPLSTAESASLPTHTPITPTPTAPAAETLQAWVIRSGAAVVRSGAGEEYTALGEIATGQRLTVLGVADDGAWVYVRKETLLGYVAADSLQMQPQDAPTALLHDAKFPRLLAEGEWADMQGIIDATQPLQWWKLTVTNNNTFATVLTYSRALQNRTQCDLADYQQSFSFAALPPGDFTLEISARSAWGTHVLLRTPLTVLGRAAEAVHVTDDCQVRVSSGMVQALLDDADNTVWLPATTTGCITVTLPQDVPCDGIAIAYATTRARCHLQITDAQGRVLRTYATPYDTQELLHSYYPLPQGAAQVLLSVYQAQGGISELRVYARGQVGPAVQRFQPPPDKVDLLLVAAHQDDELLFFGGALPYYSAVEKREVLTLYMANCAYHRYTEALHGLWSAGVRTHPLFLGLRDQKTSLSATYAIWPEHRIVGMLVDVLRQYRPEVVLTHDRKGEYGHSQHILTSRYLQRAVQCAADPRQYPDSYRQYGAWQVKKLYVHLGDEPPTRMDWDTPSNALQGLTPYQAAVIGYDKHISQHSHYSMDDMRARYDSTHFTLLFSTVGEDEARNDLFEHLP